MKKSQKLFYCITVALALLWLADHAIGAAFGGGPDVGKPPPPPPSNAVK